MGDSFFHSSLKGGQKCNDLSQSIQGWAPLLSTDYSTVLCTITAGPSERIGTYDD